MSKLNVNIQIGDRTYPLMVDAEQEGSLRAAAKQLSGKLNAYRSQFGIADQVDLLSMVALFYAHDNLQKDANAALNPEKLQEELEKIDALIDGMLP